MLNFVWKRWHLVLVILCCCVVIMFIYQLRCRTCEQEYNYYQMERDQDSKPSNPIPRIEQRGEYWVFYNVLVATKTFAPYESVTYTTQGDFTFLDNLQPLLERWDGPISIALYAPGDDFERTVEYIHYLRDCTTSNLIREFVTFHVFFDNDHPPKKIQNLIETVWIRFNSSYNPSCVEPKWSETYRSSKNLTYPINVARNVAKESSQTYYVLASDIELYPSINIINNFLEMINRTQIGSNRKLAVFPLNVFEVEEDAEIPATKTKLLEMLKNKKAIKFHQQVCEDCHNTPGYNKWIRTKETENLNVFYVDKRRGKFKFWEPFYIGTKNDPSFDERLSWEGQKNKRIQAYVLCIKNYDMKVLDNAFLVHKPGIKVYKDDPYRNVHVANTNDLIENVIKKEYEILYGVRKGCDI